MTSKVAKLASSLKPAPLGTAVVAWNTTFMFAAVSGSPENATQAALSILGAFAIASVAGTGTYLATNRLLQRFGPD